MSRFFSEKYKDLTAYVPGEQPKERKYVKLNTNESPFPPSPYAQRLAREAAGDLRLYSDPDCSALVEIAAEKLGVKKENLLFSNSSDEMLNFAFMAFCDETHPAAFPDITYGFYPVFAKLNGVPYEEIPLREDFSVDVPAFLGINKTIFLANPNAPTGIYLPLSEIEKILQSNPDNVVVVDEAYVDFGGESAKKLLDGYENLLVVQTFSKSRSMAGARLGFCIANEGLIRDLTTVKYSTNPYNVNRMTMAAGVGALADGAYFAENCEKIKQNRAFTERELVRLGFEMTESSANFVFAKHPALSGEEIYKKLKEKGVLVRHFSLPRIKEYNRITIGSKEEMQTLVAAMEEILQEENL